MLLPMLDTLHILCGEGAHASCVEIIIQLGMVSSVIKDLVMPIVLVI